MSETHKYQCPKCSSSLAQVVISEPLEGDLLPEYPYRDRLVWWCPSCKSITGEIDVVVSSRMLNRIGSETNQVTGEIDGI